MVNSPLIKPYFWGGVALGGVARIPMTIGYCYDLYKVAISWEFEVMQKDVAMLNFDLISS